MELPELKKRKVEGSGAPSPRNSSASQLSADIRPKRGNFTVTPVPQTSRVDLKIQQAKNFAVTQAQQERATGNFRIFDSPFGNFLVPVIPTRQELSR